jgi:hypothetical protein
MPMPLGEDLPVALRLDIRRRRAARGRVPLAGGRFLDLPVPAIDREAADAELLRRGSNTVLCRVLQDLGLP